MVARPQLQQAGDIGAVAGRRPPVARQAPTVSVAATTAAPPWLARGHREGDRKHDRGKHMACTSTAVSCCPVRQLARLLALLRVRRTHVVLRSGCSSACVWRPAEGARRSRVAAQHIPCSRPGRDGLTHAPLRARRRFDRTLTANAVAFDTIQAQATICIAERQRYAARNIRNGLMAAPVYVCVFH